MELSVYDVAAWTPVEELKNRVVIVVDILRATSVIVTALHNGAVGIMPVLTIEAAEAKAAQFTPGTCLRGGERNAVKIPQFDLGNSPLEYTSQVVMGRTIILTTSNGTRAIHHAQSANTVLIGSCLNAQAVAHQAYQLAIQQETDLALLCAGTLDRFSLDDFYCAGLITHILTRLDQAKNSLRLSDSAVAARRIYEGFWQNPIALLTESAVYRKAIKLGLEADFNYCLQRDLFKIVPYVEGNGLIIGM